MEQYINNLTNDLIDSIELEIEVARQRKDKEMVTYLRGKKQGIMALYELLNKFEEGEIVL